MAMEYLICGFSSFVFFSFVLLQIDFRIESLHIFIRVGGDIGGSGWWQWAQCDSFIQRFTITLMTMMVLRCVLRCNFSMYMCALGGLLCVDDSFFSFYSWATEPAIKLESIVRIRMMISFFRFSVCICMCVCFHDDTVAIALNNINRFPMAKQ